jgi:hypothetical protein
VDYPVVARDFDGIYNRNSGDGRPGLSGGFQPALNQVHVYERSSTIMDYYPLAISKVLKPGGYGILASPAPEADVAYLGPVLPNHQSPAQLLSFSADHDDNLVDERALLKWLGCPG